MKHAACLNMCMCKPYCNIHREFIPRYKFELKVKYSEKFKK